MNEHAKIKTPARPPASRPGAIVGSRKVYAAPKGHPDIRVPFREIDLSDPIEPPVRVYDASGPYTDADARIDLAAGLAAGARGLDRRRGLRRDSRPRGEAGGQRPRLAPSGSRRIARRRAALRARRARPARSPNTNSPAPASSPKR